MEFARFIVRQGVLMPVGHFIAQQVKLGIRCTAFPKVCQRTFSKHLSSKRPSSKSVENRMSLRISLELAIRRTLIMQFG
jgi:hypothetical protein